MDFPKSVPGVGLVNGVFVDEDALAAKPGSLIPSVWGNSVTLEILNVLAAAGVTPDELKVNQLAEAISQIAKGSAVAWSRITGKPTTAAGYGITDVYIRTQIDSFLAAKADKSNTMVIDTGGIGAKSSPQAINVNTLPYGGLWSVNPGTIGAPFANGSVLHNAYDVASGNWTQIFADMGGSSVYWRGSLNYSISNFKKFWDSENFNPALKVTGDSCPTAGFYAGSKVRPYMLHADATVVELPTLAQLIATNAAVGQRITAINCAQAGFVDGTTNTPFMTHNNGTTVGLARADNVVGVGQSWQDVTGGRAASTIYTNTTPKPIMVSVYSGNDLRNELRLTVGGVEVSKFALASSAGAQSIASVTAIVPSGATYIVSIGSGAISKWTELR
ncbi:hypothetical protein ACI77J_09415 [Pseudomonas sp. O64]|uniref:hypothetical protein n=1 Tax=unclassified Pseudomonas TaxID=196821 RepID=UPI00387AB688